MTRSSGPISLFAEPSISRRGPGSFVLSILAHLAGIGLGYYVITHLPQIEERSVLERFTVRELDLHTTDPLLKKNGAAAAGEDKIPYPGPVLGTPVEVTEAMHSMLISAAGRQTLVQPAFHTSLAFAEATPIPTLVIWTPELATSKKIVAPLPNPPTASNVTPSMQLPNEEMSLAEMSVKATNQASPKQELSAGTTSPLDRRSDDLPQMAPETTSLSTETPTPTAVLSLSDLRMLDGTLRLPPLNDVAPVSTSARPGEARQPAPGANGEPHGNRADARQNPAPGSGDGDDGPSGADRLTTEHITLPKDGRFGVVVVGSSLGDDFPETLAMWNNRVAYTAYLHVGLTKNWILQYAMIRSTDANQSGLVGHLEAPWPYDIVRPNLLSRDLNADALLIHGFLNRTGRLESLSVAFPSGFRYSSFVLHALRQWQFRPALQNGQATAVEVLLIIPDELE